MEHKHCVQAADPQQETICYTADMETYEMLHMSRPAMELFGIQSPEEYRGQTCFQLLHGTDHPCTFCTNHRITQEQSVTWVQYNAKLKKWMLIDDHFVESGDRKCRMETMREIDSRQHWSQELTAQLKMETILLQCLQTLSANKDMHAAVSSFLEMVSRFYCADRAYIFEIDAEKQTLSNTFEWCAEGVTQEIDLLQNLPLEIVDDWMEKFRTVGEFCISSIDSDLDSNSVEYRLLAQQEVDSLMAAPLYLDGNITGFIGVDNPGSNLRNTNLLRATSDFVAVELDKRHMMEELEYLNSTDILTGVYNRRKYNRDLNARYRNIPEKLGIVLLNINSLSNLNNTYGQKYGDTILVKTARILRQMFTQDIYRIGGDEFFIPCPDMERTEFLDKVAELRRQFKDHPDYSVSIGVSWQSGNVNIDEQIIQAGNHMRAEKQSYYQHAFENGHQLSSNPALDVLEEIAAGRFKVHYQPKVNLRTKEIVGVEALVRKTDETGHIISPAQFIPAYEARNVMMHVDMFVLETALQTVRKMKDSGYDLYVAVNFSRSTLMTPDFVSRILTMCKKANVPTSAIVLEVTETISTLGREYLRELLQEIRQAGLRLSLDDFGSQYSNASILADIEFDEVKLDKTLVDDICQSSRSRTILKHLMEMCRALENTTVVAEGIETADQAAVLEGLNCDLGQGFHFYRPMPLQQLEELLEK